MIAIELVLALYAACPVQPAVLQVHVRAPGDDEQVFGGWFVVLGVRSGGDLDAPEYLVGVIVDDARPGVIGDD